MANDPEFSKLTKRLLAERAAYLCSRPECRDRTIAPDTSKPDNVFKYGDAAHIRGARPDSARYDENQINEERASITNGIWLCTKHHRIVDCDESYTAEQLLGWKREHEEWLSTREYLPGFPIVLWSTIRGLHSRLSPHGVDGNMVAQYRDHELRLRAGSRHELRDVLLDVQLLEGIENVVLAEAPAAVQMRAQPKHHDLVMSATGSGSVTIIGPRPPPIRITIDVSRLTPDRDVCLLLRTVKEHRPESLDAELFAGSYRQYIIGSFNYDVYDSYAKRSFFVPLELGDDRRITSGRVEELGGQRIVESFAG